MLNIMTGPPNFASPKATPQPLRAAPPATASQLATANIEDIEVGQRVHVDLPARIQEAAIGKLAEIPDWDRLNAEIAPAKWRKLTLTMDGDSGDRFDIVLLRPLSWIEETGANSGGSIHLLMPEQGLDGPAKVVSIEPCPPIHAAAGRVVTGTITHIRGGILRLHLEGLPEPLGVTANHTVYSADRNAFLPAGELEVGEHLRDTHGLIRVAGIEHIPAEQRVYNLEIHGAHVYHVTSAGVLVHNASTRTLQPGAFAGDSIPARGPERDFKIAERQDINANGQKTGCHTCGSKDPGTKSGDFIPDHQPPNALNTTGGPQNLLPHCLSCSRQQGGEIRALQQSH